MVAVYNQLVRIKILARRLKSDYKKDSKWCIQHYVALCQYSCNCLIPSLAFILISLHNSTAFQTAGPYISAHRISKTCRLASYPPHTNSWGDSQLIASTPAPGRGLHSSSVMLNPLQQYDTTRHESQVKLLGLTYYIKHSTPLAKKCSPMEEEKLKLIINPLKTKHMFHFSTQHILHGKHSPPQF